ncbi:MAG: homoserine dehydrogenase [Syntrophobacterales bacterium]|nr:homoserine dehydrogenase [Syntrophobacterales bacterium]
MRDIVVGLIGWGTVGSGVVSIIQSSQDVIRKRLGTGLKLKWVADKDLERPRSVAVPKEILTRDVNIVLSDPEVDIIIELVGGIEAAKNFIERALQEGKHVVTANKALLAHHGNELFSLASRREKVIAYEASVAGGIPFIKILREGLAANRINVIVGILNGTCNFILTRMREANLPFEEALREAQRLGYAEADPSLDVDGIDTAHKLAIASSLAFNMPIAFDSIFIEGIRNVDPLDIQYGEEFGYQLKLLAIAKQKQNGEVELRVHPTFVPSGHVLASVRGAYNAVFINGDAVGDTMFYGLGAGMMPTGSAVVADLIDISRSLIRGTKPLDTMPSFEGTTVKVVPMEEIVSSYYFRFSAVDRPGVLSKISGILGSHDISISAVIQKGRSSASPDDPVPIVMLTHEAKERAVQRAVREINQLDVVRAPTQLIRIEDL